MLIFENIKLALNGLLSNKLRSLLTMLGIIIGIGSVIAIMTVSSSLTTSITDTFAEMGANNVTVGVKQKSEQQETRSNGMKFGKSNKQVSLDEEDRITDDMIEQVKKQFSSQIDSISLSESAGSGTVKSGENSANVSLTGINTGYFDANDITLLAGRYLTDQDVDGKKSVIMVSNKVVENMFDGDNDAALGQKINVDIDNVYYSFYIVGVYEYDEDADSFSSDSDEDVTTTAYLPITSSKEKFHTDDGYEQFTIVTASTVSSVTDFAESVENYMNLNDYAQNEDYEISSSTMSSMTSSMNEMIRHSVHRHCFYRRHFPFGRGNRCHEYHAGVHYRADQRDRNQKGIRCQKQFHPSAVYYRIHDLVSHWRYPGDHPGADPGRGSSFDSWLFSYSTGNSYDRIRCILHGDRYFLRILSGQQGSQNEPNRSPALRIRRVKKIHEKSPGRSF